MSREVDSDPLLFLNGFLVFEQNTNMAFLRNSKFPKCYEDLLVIIGFVGCTSFG